MPVFNPVHRVPDLSPPPQQVGLGAGDPKDQAGRQPPRRSLNKFKGPSQSTSTTPAAG